MIQEERLKRFTTELRTRATRAHHLPRAIRIFRERAKGSSIYSSLQPAGVHALRLWEQLSMSGVAREVCDFNRENAGAA